MTASRAFDPKEAAAAGHAGREPVSVTDDVSVEECVVRLTGELSHDNAPALRAALRRCDDSGAARLLVDCSSLDFCDSTGLGSLLDARTRAQARGAAVVLVGLGPGVARVFDLTGAAALFPRFRTVAEARAAA